MKHKKAAISPKVTIEYRVTRYSEEDDVPDEPVFFDTEEGAMNVARGMASKGALSSEPGDRIYVERVTTEIITFFDRK